MYVNKDTSASGIWLIAGILTLALTETAAIADFSVPISAYSRIWAMAIQSDQRIVFGGDFLTSVDGQLRQNLARLNQDGSVDLTFHPQGATIVTALAIQTDGKILVTGIFTNLAGQVCNNLARLNPDGSPDLTFNSPNPEQPGWGFAIQPDGKILLVGGFAGATNRYLTRLNLDGSLDHTFRPALNQYLNSVVLQQDGKILLSGPLPTRLHPDGSVDTSFKAATIAQNSWSIALQSDGRVLVSFSRPPATSTNLYAVRLNSDGSLDTNFNAALHATINSFGLQADGKILALHNTGVARLNPDGSLDSSFHDYTNWPGFSLVLADTGQYVFNPTGSLEARANTSPAASSLILENGTATWLLDSTSPDVPTAFFEYTTNGTDWTALGSGTRIPRGWQLGGVTIPPGATLRARGGVNGASLNGSFWFSQSFFGQPVLTLQPDSTTNYVGTFSRLNVNAGGSGPLKYQWLKQGATLPGATNSTLNFQALEPSDAGTYELVVGNQFGSTRSSPAVINVLPLPRIFNQNNGLQFTNGEVSFYIDGQLSETMVIEWSGNLVNWVPIQTNVLNSVPFPFRETPPAKYTRRFYRVRVAPK